MNTRHYTPGQRLNAAAEVMTALLDGQRVTWENAEPHEFWELINGHLVYDDGEKVEDFWVKECVRYIYTPPKRKVKSERWFAVFQNDYDTDGVSWSGPFSSKTEVETHYPTALAYHCATVEVEVPNDFG